MALNWTHFILKKPGITWMIYEARQAAEEKKKKKIFFSNPTWQQKRQRASLCKGRLRALRGLGSFWSWSWVSITCRHCLCWATNDAAAQLTEGKSRQIRSAEEKSIAFLLWKETYRKKNILRRCTYVSALLSTNLPALTLFVLKCRAGLKCYPCLVCFTSELGKNGASCCHTEGFWE